MRVIPEITVLMSMKLQGRKILVACQGYKIEGILLAVDSHMNLLLDDAVIIYDDRQEKHGKLIVRGSEIKYISFDELIA